MSHATSTSQKPAAHLRTPAKTPVVGIDVGGANLKFAATNKTFHALAFPMWKRSQSLAEALADGIQRVAPNADAPLAVTMTGELADCFPTRRVGVKAILDAVAQAHSSELTSVYSVDGRWLTIQQATANPWDVAASNWHALANWVLQTNVAAHPIDLIIDIGSTTTDIIPVASSGVATPARTDRDRLELQQLVYTGCERTAVGMICPSFSLHNKEIAAMAELFADSGDAHTLLEWTPEEPANHETCDGKPRTMANAHGRMARMIGEDVETLPLVDAQTMARQVVDRQMQQILSAVQQNLPTQKVANVLFSGHANRLSNEIAEHMKKAWNIRVFNLEEKLSPDVARNAPAFAVAQLLQAQRG